MSPARGTAGRGGRAIQRRSACRTGKPIPSRWKNSSRSFHTDLERGLTAQEAQNRLQKFGANELAKEERASPIALFLAQFKSTLIIILLVATVLSAALGEIIDAAIIAVIVLFCAVLSFVQEYRADNALKALKKMLAPTIRVLRDGAETRIPSRAVVPGDIMVLEAGDRLPADARLVEVHSLQCDEAPLTGESFPVEKSLTLIAARRRGRRPPQRRLHRDHGDLWPGQGDGDEHGDAHGIRPDRRTGLRGDHGGLPAREADRGDRPLAGIDRARRLRHRDRGQPRSGRGWGISSMSS